jgi:hypothetical protein
MCVLVGEFVEERRDEPLTLLFNVEAEAVVCLDDAADSVFKRRVAGSGSAIRALPCVDEVGSGYNKPKIPTLIKKLEGTALTSRSTIEVAAHDMYRDTLIAFLRTWIYSNTDQSDFASPSSIAITCCMAWMRATSTGLTTSTASSWPSTQQGLSI